MIVGVSEWKYFDSIIYLKSLYEYYFENEIRGYDLHQTDIYLSATIVAKKEYYKVDSLRISFPNIGKKLLIS